MTTIGLDNTGFLKFSTDIEMGDPNVFNTTGSKLWQKVVLLFENELKQQYALMRQDRFTLNNIMKYIYEEQISQIPAKYYNIDMQTKYLNYGSSYLYALHGSGEQHIKKWIRERLMYCDTLLGYNVSTSDYITLRSSKLGEVYLDIQTYIPMYVRVKWRDEANNTGVQVKKVKPGETVRFSYNMPTATDQEIIVYGGYYLKSLGDVSNLQPTTMLIANASRLTEIECHSPNLINTDLSECTKLQRIDLSDCTALGTGIGAQPILNIQKCNYLRYCNCLNTQLTAIYTMQQGGNLEEIYYPKSTQVIQVTNQTYLKVLGIPYGFNNKVVYLNKELNIHHSYWWNNCYNTITSEVIDNGISIPGKKDEPIPVEFGKNYYIGCYSDNKYMWQIYEFNSSKQFVSRPMITTTKKGAIYTPSNSDVVSIKFCAYYDGTNIPCDISQDIILIDAIEGKTFLESVTECKNLATVTIANCNAIEYMQYPYYPNDPIKFDALKYVQNLTLSNSLDRLTEMTFQGFSKMKNVTLSSMSNLEVLGFDDMLPVGDTSTFKTLTLSDCPKIDKVTFNVSSDDYKVSFAKNAKVDLGGMQSVKTIESNASIKGLDTLIIPLGLEYLIFSTEFGDGINEIKNIWSSNAFHNGDGFEGIDLQDMNLKFIDMLGLSQVQNAINFNLSPTDRDPHMNTSRDGSESKPWFRPNGSINLNNYTGDMTGLLRGIDFNKFNVELSVNKNQTDLTGLFEHTIGCDTKTITDIMSKFPNSNKWDYLLAYSDVSPDIVSALEIPTDRKMSLKGMYKGTNITEDIDLPSNVIAADEMFMNCTKMTTVHENWNKEYKYGITTSNCYKGGQIDVLDDIPIPWGGNGFERLYATIFEIVLPEDNMTITVNNRPDIKGSCNTNWGDGSSINTEKSHTYAKAGTYIVKFRNSYMGNPEYQLGNYRWYVSRYINIPKYAFQNNGTPFLISSLTFYGHSRLESIDWDRCYCKDNIYGISFQGSNSPYLTEIDLSMLDLSKVTSLVSSFENCKSTVRITGLESITDKCTDIQKMCHGCTSLEYICDFDTSGVIYAGGNQTGAFMHCKSLTELPTLDFSSCKQFTRIVSGCTLLKELNIINMNSMTTVNDGYINGGIFGDGCGVTVFRTLDLSNMPDDYTANPLIAGVKLETLELKGTISKSVCISSWGDTLSVSAMLNIFDALVPVTESKQLILGETNLDKLTDEQKAIAINKGWTLS